MEVFTRTKARVEATDWKKWAKNTAVFFAPFALVFLLAISNGSDVKDALNILYLYALNVAIDLIKKFISANPTK